MLDVHARNDGNTLRISGALTFAEPARLRYWVHLEPICLRRAFFSFVCVNSDEGRFFANVRKQVIAFMIQAEVCQSSRITLFLCFGICVCCGPDEKEGGNVEEICFWTSRIDVVVLAIHCFFF